MGEPYRIHQLSVSKVELFDACARHWWFDFPQGLKPEQDNAQSEGDKGHALIAGYLSTGNGPEGRVKMGTAVRNAIAKGLFPKPGPDLLVERRFSGQAKLDADGKWVPLDPALAPIWSRGIPWDGFIDVMYRRDDAVTVEDHKFSSDIRAPWSKKADQLLATVQMPLYGLVGLSLWPDATHVRLTHNNIARSGGDTDKRTYPSLVTREQLFERKAVIDQSVAGMIDVGALTVESEVPYNFGGCEAYGGCPHQSICSAFKQRRIKMNELTAEEMAMFDDVQIPDSTVAAVLPPDAPPNDASTPPPEKKAKKKPSLIVDESTTPDEELKAARGFCASCGAGLTPANSAGKSGGFKHIGCPAGAPAPAPIVAPPPPAPVAVVAKPEAPKPAPVAPTVTKPIPPEDPWKRIARALHAFADALEK